MAAADRATFSEVSSLLGLWGTALKEAHDEKGQPGAAVHKREEDQEEEEEEDTPEHGLPLLGLDLTLLARCGFSEEDASALGISALRGGEGVAPQDVLRAAAQLTHQVWCTLRGLPPSTPLPSTSRALVPYTGEELATDFPEPLSGRATLAAVESDSDRGGGGGGGGEWRLACGGTLRLAAGGVVGEEGGGLWDAHSEALLVRAFAFHASTTFCMGDTRAWSLRGGGEGRCVYALLPFPSGCTWGGLTLPKAWARVAEPLPVPHWEAVRALLEEAHRTLSFKAKLLNGIPTIPPIPHHPWTSLDEASLSQEPLFRCLLPLCDRQFSEDGVVRVTQGGKSESEKESEKGSEEEEEEAGEGYQYPRASVELVVGALHLALSALGSKGGGESGGEGVSWASAAAPTFIEVLNGWEEESM